MEMDDDDEDLAQFTIFNLTNCSFSLFVPKKSAIAVSKNKGIGDAGSTADLRML